MCVSPTTTSQGWKAPGTPFHVAIILGSKVAELTVTEYHSQREMRIPTVKEHMLLGLSSFSYLFWSPSLCCLQVCFKCQLMSSLWSRLFIFTLSTTWFYSWDFSQIVFDTMLFIIFLHSSVGILTINHPDIKVSIDSEIL